MYNENELIGLMLSKKTSVMTMPKCLGAHIWLTRCWQIYPPNYSRHHGKNFFYLINIIALWDVFGSHSGLFQEIRWEFSLIS